MTDQEAAAFAAISPVKTEYEQMLEAMTTPELMSEYERAVAAFVEDPRVFEAHAVVEKLRLARRVVARLMAPPPIHAREDWAELLRDVASDIDKYYECKPGESMATSANLRALAYWITAVTGSFPATAPEIARVVVEAALPAGGTSVE